MDQKISNNSFPEEIKLDQYIESLDKKYIEVPDELENRIRQRVDTLKKKRSVWPKVLSVCAAVCILFVAGIRFSPVFAEYASGIPGMKGIVEFIRGDSGLDRARENGYGGVSPVMVEENGYILNIDGIFFDEDRLRFVATVSGEKIDDMLPQVSQEVMNAKDVRRNIGGSQDLSELRLDVEIKNFEDGSYHAALDVDRKDVLAYDIEKILQPGEAKKFLDTRPENINIDVKIVRGNEAVHTFEAVQMPFNASSFKLSKVYGQNRKLTIEKGEILLDKIVISPTRMRMEITFSMNEGYTFAGFENPSLKDDKGNIYKAEGLISTHSSPTKRVLYFVPSMYFEEIPKKLYFCFDGVRIASEEGIEQTLCLGDEYPKIIEYMGIQIEIEDVEWHSGNLYIDCKLPAKPLLKIQGFELADDRTASMGYGSHNEEDESGIVFEYIDSIIEVDEQDAYNVRLSFPGYLISAKTECELDLK